MSSVLQKQHLHPLIYFIADKPAKGNISAKIPLVGTKSYQTFLEWLARMNVDIGRVRMYNQIDDPFSNPMSNSTLNQAIMLKQIKVVALGQKASDYLMKVGIKEYWMLPHPSGSNRILNDKKLVKQKLESCKEYIYGI